MTEKRCVFIVLGVMALMMAGCADAGFGDSVLDRVETKVTPSGIEAGQSAQVICSVMTLGGHLVEATTIFSVTPDDGIETDGARITATQAGEFVVRCEAPEHTLLDEEGAVLTVVEAKPVVVITQLEEDTIAVFDTTGVACLVQDAFGNAVALDAEVVGDEGLNIEDWTVGSENVGTYEVRCEVDADLGLQVEAAVLDVTADEPAEIVLAAKPPLENYKVGQMIEVYWVVRDAYGNQILGLPAEFEIPETGLTIMDADAHKYRFDEEGLYPFTITLDEPHGLLTDHITLVVDASPPEVVITWPARGETVLGQGDFLYVEGTVTDALGHVEAFEVNGVSVGVAEDGSFETVILPEWGLNLIEAFAQDQYGNTAKVTPTFLYSSAFMDYQEASLADVYDPDGIELLLGQEFLDDGDHDKEHVDDLATLLEILLGDMDISQLIGGTGSIPVTTIPIVDQSFAGGAVEIFGEVEINVQIVEPTDIGPTSVVIDSRLGGIDSSIEMGDAEQPGFALNLEVVVSLIGEAEILGGLAGASLEGTTSVVTGMSIERLIMASKIDIQKAPGEDLFVDVVQIEAEFVNLQIDPIQELTLAFELDDLPFGLGPFSFEVKLSDLIDLNTLTDAILDPLTQNLLPLLMDLVTPLIETFADEILVQLLMALELETSLPLPELLGPKPEPVELELGTRLSSVQFDDEGGQIGLAIGLFADKGTERDSLGAIRRDGCLGGEEDDFVYGWDRSLGIAFKTDVINAGFFSAWWSGFLDGPADLSVLMSGQDLPIPLEGLNVELEWLSPPVISDCGGKGVIELGVGDLFVRLDAELLGSPVKAEMFVDASLSVFFGASEEGLTVTIGDFKFLDVEVLSYDEIAGGLLDLEDLLENQLYGLASSLLVGQSFGPIALPPIDLSETVPGLPEGASIELGNLSVTKDSGYVVLGMDFQ